MPTTSLVLTILGPDRPGLVESIARLVAEHQGNWLESRMAHLAGQFAGILRVEVEADSADSLSQALAGLAKSGLETVIHPDPAIAIIADRPLVALDLLGQDRPGIVRQISGVLAALGVNVEELNTECRAAAETGQPLFHAAAQLRLPPDVSEADLRVALENVAADLMVEVKLAEK
ncbi:glycine cleavage system protein R [Lacipirellula sp.]|uniref:glycine cleavage system protein R n=1 Tax=Lacipirellula sp. TaxID=2691419 RepID=UPI003D1245A1